MQICEVLLAAASAILLSWCALWHDATPVRRWMMRAPLLLLAAHVPTDGWRVEMVPVYAVVCALAVAPMMNMTWRPAIILSALAGLGFVAVGVGLSSVYPVFSLPEPPGSLPVGGLTLTIAGPGDVRGCSGGYRRSGAGALSRETGVRPVAL